MKKCAECKAGENSVPADYLILILDDVRETKPRPCRKYVCQEHMDMLDMDGSSYKIERNLR